MIFFVIFCYISIYLVLLFYVFRFILSFLKSCKPFIFIAFIPPFFVFYFIFSVLHILSIFSMFHVRILSIYVNIHQYNCFYIYRCDHLFQTQSKLFFQLKPDICSPVCCLWNYKKFFVSGQFAKHSFIPFIMVFSYSASRLLFEQFCAPWCKQFFIHRLLLLMFETALPLDLVNCISL